MQTNLAETALSKLKSFISASETSIDSKLFQFISNTSKISRFVAGVIIEQCEQTLKQLQWHSTHFATDFNAQLEDELTSRLFVDQFYYSPGKTPQLNDFVDQFHNEAAVMSLLRQVRRKHSAAIAILELNADLNIEESMQRMSILAEELIRVAYLWSYAKQVATFGMPVPNDESNDLKPQNMLVLAMGKLGGFELNFSSDIDLIFFYLSDGQTAGGRRQIENSRFFQKVGVSLIKLLDEKTQDGFVFRVDMRLRPYGDSGSLVMSVAQAEDYYHEQGRGWERFAMVRARIITGRIEEQQALKEIITPFAFRRYIDYGVIDSLRNMKQMIQREVRRRSLKGNIKLGAGGIREIEFMVQSLQLIQGGRDKRLQEKSLLKVLPLLVEEKLLPADTSTELAENYRFLRRLEHCIQELDEKQTQQLPDDEKTQAVIANLMGFDNWQVFGQFLEKVQSNTNAHFSALFGEELNELEQQDDFFLSLWDGYISAEQLSERFYSNEEHSDNGERNTYEEKCAIKFIDILNKFRQSSLVNSLSTRGSKRLRAFFPELLDKCIQVENPVKTLESLLVILKAILKRTAYLELLSENLPILQHLVDLVSRSDWIVHRLSECPILFDELLYPNSLYQPLQAVDLQSELQQSLLRIDENDEEQILDAIRHFKQINELRIAAALLSERLSISQVSRYLTQLAQVIIQVSMNQCWRYLTSKHGQPVGLTDSKIARTGFTVIAYGKLGGVELGFNSDLDLVFLYDQPAESQTNGKQPTSASRFYTRFAQKLIHFLSTRTSSGVLYEVDMRLRPSGNSGLLVSHIDAFEIYQKESAWTWEHQALVRARAIAGDTELCKKFSQVRKDVITTKRDQAKLKTDVMEMRNKMRQELNKSTTKELDLKQCVGGLVDIEFLAQYFVLSDVDENDKEHNLPPSNTVEAINYSKHHQQLSSQDATCLIDIYRRYRNYLNEMVIISGNTLINVDSFIEERKQVESIWRLFLAK